MQSFNDGFLYQMHHQRNIGLCPGFQRLFCSELSPHKLLYPAMSLRLQTNTSAMHTNFLLTCEFLEGWAWWHRYTGGRKRTYSPLIQKPHLSHLLPEDYGVCSQNSGFCSCSQWHSFSVKVVYPARVSCFIIYRISFTVPLTLKSQYPLADRGLWLHYIGSFLLSEINTN